jgi:F0F1-type ATP synthase assembly protein I
MITHLLALLVGFVAGLLVYRKHAEKLKAAEADARAKADAVKSALK